MSQFAELPDSYSQPQKSGGGLKILLWVLGIVGGLVILTCGGCIVGSVEVSLSSPAPLANWIPTVMRIPTGSMRLPPRLTRPVANDCMETFMSLRRGGPSAVYRSVVCILGATPSNSKPSWVRHVTQTVGRSLMFCPTPGRSATTGIPRLLRCSAGPTPDSMSV